MKAMKFILLTFILCLTSMNALALELSDFKITVQDNGDHILSKKDPSEIFIRLQKPGANFELKRVFEKKGFSDLVFVEYLSATIGTSVIVNLYRVAIFDTKTNSFIGDIPSKKQVKDRELPYLWKKSKEKIVVLENNKIIQEVSLK